MPGAAKVVFIELLAKTDKFDKSMKKADAQVKKSTINLKLMAGVLTAALAVGLRKVARAFDEFAQQGDDIAKLARGLRLTTDELQEIQFTLERTGGAGGSVRNMILAIDKALGDAVGGSKEYVDSFEALGLNFEEIAAMDPAARFWELRRAVQASKGDVEASAGAQIILGRGFKANVATMQETEKNIEGVREEYKKLGGVSTEAAKLSETVEDLNTNWEALKNNLKSIAFEKIAPTVIEARKSLEAFTLGLKEAGLLDGVVTAMLAAVTAGFIALTVAVVAFTVAAFPVVGTVLLITAAVAGAVAGIATAILMWGDFTQALKLFFTDIWRFATSIGASIADTIKSFFDFELPQWAVTIGAKLGLIDPEERKKQLEQRETEQDKPPPKIEIPDFVANAAGATPAPLNSGVGLKSLRTREGDKGGPPVIQNFYQVSGGLADQLMNRVKRDNQEQLRTNQRGES